MLLLKQKFSIYNFIICLKSLKLYKFIKVNVPQLHNSQLYYHPLLAMRNILEIHNINPKEKSRLVEIIIKNSSYSNKRHNTLIYQYIKKFTHEHRTYYKKSHNEYDKKQLNIHTIAYIYLYTVYRLLKSKNPLYIFFYLIYNNK